MLAIENLLSNYPHTLVLDATFGAQALFSFCFLVSSFVAFGNKYAGSVAVLSGLVFAGFTAGSYYGIRKRISRTSYGAVLGGASILVVLSLQTAVFWGQYANCEAGDESVVALRSGEIGVECTHVGAMKSVCTFSVFLFLSYIFQMVVLYAYKDLLLGTVPLDEGLGAPRDIGVRNPIGTHKGTYE